jgi:hypothetical protein
VGWSNVAADEGAGLKTVQGHQRRSLRLLFTKYKADNRSKTATGEAERIEYSIILKCCTGGGEFGRRNARLGEVKLSEKFESVSRPNWKHFNDSGFSREKSCTKQDISRVNYWRWDRTYHICLGDELLVKTTEAEDH